MRNKSKIGPIWETSLPIVRLGREYLEWMRVKNYTRATIRSHHYYLGFFFQWCDSRTIGAAHEVTKNVIEEYRNALHSFYSERLKGILTLNSRHRYFESVRLFFRWVCKKRTLLFDPTGGLNISRPKNLPSHILNREEAERVINEPDTRGRIGIRDRAILETLYSTGIRRQELAGLTLDDLDVQRGIILVVEGKGRKDRIVPIGERALHWIEKYLSEVRSSLTKNRTERSIFLTKYGTPFKAGTLTVLTRSYIKAANIGKKGACHIFRHTMATLMLENGADIRYIQEMLGHAQLTTTQAYTQVEASKLKEVHRRTHPAEKGEGEK